ncbi:galactokinase [Muriicola sp. Z0-33]|uniref:galactokinase n=1 Tax=Muriicola sp. Z0-33 TaxID=2816957 RepID=UPI002237BA74|nr:galactokinase [Muriicola sp. Z0-33]MCW5517136.1 galactokinase [Muriicola sp. Z0-33]
MDIYTMNSFDPDLIIESPGRINLIGEHTDYNMGYVLPTAINKKITFRFRKNKSEHICKVYSKDFDKSLTIDLRKVVRSITEWENYVLGVINEIQKLTDELRGFDCTLESTVPLGSGVSSSAALECGMAFGLNQLFNLGLSESDIVALSQKAEHTFVGTQCGIMDQFASVMSREDHVILLDCNTLEHEYIPINLEPYKIVLLNTHVSHNLASSEYNTRKMECEQGVAILKKKYDTVGTLRDATLEMLKTVKDEMDNTIYKRCMFIIEENERVMAMTKALKENDLKTAGKILYDGHSGLSELYEISCPESDFLVNFSKGIPGVLGARQMGGGFGGCTINLVHEDVVDDYIRAISAVYYEEFGLRLTSFEGFPSKGTSIIYKK